ncbi:hypothetical protein SB753_39725, partial [Paraburkholderia sp. SIMBA_053]
FYPSGELSIQSVEGIAVFGTVVVEQSWHLIERDSESGKSADPEHPDEVMHTVSPVAVAPAWRLGEDSELMVMAQGADGDAGEG